MSYRSRRTPAPLHDGQKIPLTLDQLSELTSGVCIGPYPFANEGAARAAWKQYGPRIVRTFMTDDPDVTCPGPDFSAVFPPSTRPYAYWNYEHPEDGITMPEEDSWEPAIVRRRLELLAAHGDLLDNETVRATIHMSARGLGTWATTATR